MPKTIEEVYEMCPWLIDDKKKATKLDEIFPWLENRKRKEEVFVALIQEIDELFPWMDNDKEKLKFIYSVLPNFKKYFPWKYNEHTVADDLISQLLKIMDTFQENAMYVKLISQTISNQKKEQKQELNTFNKQLQNMNIQIRANWKRAIILFVALNENYDVNETNEHLKKAGMAQLYPRDLFDACIMFCLNNNIGASEFERFYKKAETYLPPKSNDIDHNITISMLKKIISDTTSSDTLATICLTDEIASFVMECTTEEEFFDFVQNDLSPIVSETYQLQRRYLSLYLYYLLRARSQEILGCINDFRNNGPIARRITRVLHGEINIPSNSLFSFETIINDMPEINDYEMGDCERVFNSALKSSRSLFSGENTDSYTIDDFTEISDFDNVYISMENVAEFLLAGISENYLKGSRLNNEGEALKDCINGKASLDRSSFVLLLSLIAIYLDEINYHIGNPNHILTKERFDEILVKCHYTPLNENDYADLFSMMFFDSDGYSFNYLDVADFIKSFGVNLGTISLFNIEDNKTKMNNAIKGL